jgi:hypothetical protein
MRPVDMALDGMEGGLEAAIELLESAQPDVDPENQTWDSAIAVIKICLAEARKARANGFPDHPEFRA